MSAAPALLAYVDPWSVAPGDEVELMVSATAGYDVALLRLVHGSADPRGPGVSEQVVEASLARRQGRVQRLPSGSYLRVPAAPALDLGAFTVTAWVEPTLATPGDPRALVSRRDASTGRGWAVGVDGTGRLAVWCGAGEKPVVAAERPLPLGQWSFVAATVTGTSVGVTQVPVPEWSVGSTRSTATSTGRFEPAAEGLDLLVGAWHRAEDGELVAAAHFTGRVDRPALHAGAAPAELLAAADPDRLGLPVVARWRPGQRPDGTCVPDAGAHGLHATAVNTPVRGVPGCNWTGRETDFRLAPGEYDAVHLHDDDLTDACWEPEVTYRVPEGLRSGVYAFRLTAGDERLTVPFFVRPPRGTVTARVALLLPTYTYLAYANSHSSLQRTDREPDFPVTPQHRWAAEHKVCSAYDTHRDGSGCYYVSRRRPLTTITPTFVSPFGLWNLSADLCLVDWLEHMDVRHDVLTDEDLHAEGAALLAGYDVVLAPSHPEYVTGAMLDALEQYLAAGGRLMYLGGNGYYWVTGVSPTQPHLAEIRRGHTGTRGWEVAPGETHLSTTGEPGGLWRHRGRAPQRLVGVGFAAQGGRGRGRPYHVVEPVDERGAFALEGVEGVVGADALVSHAAAGMEVDRADAALGTPPHAVVLAHASGFSDHYQLAVEEVLTSNSRQGGSVEPRVAADLVFFEGRNGGAVFATGSIAWCTALGVDGYANPVATVTGNVLRRFLDPTPFPDGRP